MAPISIYTCNVICGDKYVTALIVFTSQIICGEKSIRIRKYSHFNWLAVATEIKACG